MQKLAEKLTEMYGEVCKSEPVRESSHASEGMEVRLSDGHCVSFNMHFNIRKGYYDHNTQDVTDIEKETMVKALVKEEMDKFNKAVADKLKNFVFKD